MEEEDHMEDQEEQQEEEAMVGGVIMHLLLEELEDMDQHLLEDMERRPRLDMEEDNMEEQEQEEDQGDLLPLVVKQCHQVPILSCGAGSPLSTLIDRETSVPLN
jgi:hypothetical protein